jgi:GNAT superfamily N-acetyltransferase
VVPVHDTTHTGEEVLLEAFDRFAAEALARAAPLRVALASTPEEHEAVYRLRYRHVIGAGWATPDDLPDGMEHDRFDEGASHVMTWDGDTLVGTCRVVFPDGSRPLPAEAAFDVAIEPRGGAPTIDRLLVDAPYRGGGVMVVVLAKAWLELRRRGFGLISGAATEAVIRLFRGLGFEVTVLAGPRTYWGEERYAILAAPSEQGTPS